MTSTQVPPVDLAPGMPSRVVTISATDVTEGGQSMAGQMVRFALSDTLDVTSGGDVIAKTQAEVVLDSNGEGRIRLPVYDEDVKTWCGKDWAILVTTTWGSQKAIRVPAGTSNIALSALPNIRPLRGRELQWAVTGASVSVTEGASWDASVSLSGGVLDFDFTVPPGATAWDRTATPLSASTDLGSIENGIYSVASGTVAETLGLPVYATGIFRSVRYDDTAAIQVFETRSATPEVWHRSQIGTWRDWIRIDGTNARWFHDAASVGSVLDDLPDGVSTVQSGAVADSLGLPVRTIGHIEKVVLDGTNAVVKFTARRGTGVVEEYTTSTIGGVWQEWIRTDGPGARWLNPPASTSDTLDTIPEGVSPVRSSAVGDALGLPVQTMGYVEKTVLDSAASIVKFSARRGTGVVEEYTTTTFGGVWQEWNRSDAAGIVIPDAALGHVNLWGSSTPSGLSSYLGDSMDPYSVAVHSHARGGQWSSQTSANTSMPIRLPVQGGTIPGSGSVEINAADSILDGVDLYLAPTGDGIPGWLGGVYGRLVGYGTTFTDRGIRFERDRPGSAVSLSEPPEWIADVRTPGHMNILNAGKNDLTVGTPSAQAAAVIERRDALVQMWRDRGQDFLILGHFVNTGTGASATGRTWVEADNADALSKYPDNYLSMQEMCASPDVWDWSGIAPTSTDLAEQALGNLPPSIAGNANHFNAAGYEWVAHNVRLWLLSNGRIGGGRVPFGTRVVYAGDGVYQIT